MSYTQIELDDLGHVGTGICQCAACTGDLRDPDQPTFASLDPLAGGTANNKPIWTPDQVAAYLNRTGGQFGAGPNDLSTRSGDQSVINYGFHENQKSLFDNGYVYTNPANGRLTAFSEYFQFGAFTEAQRAATREAMGYWDDVLAVRFVETHANLGDINFGNLTNSPGTQAYSRIPTAGYATNFGGFYGNVQSIAGLAGDVWVSVSQRSNFQFDEGLYGLNTLVHEVGHSLGLSHPGNYNFAPGFAVNYINGVEYAQDARNYSIMSYWNPRDMGATATGVVTRDFDWSLMSIAYGATPMVHDILAAQKMYGADMTTRTGDTTYGFNASEGVRDAHDFVKTPWATMAIWDAGGIDTLDASGYNVNQSIDLTPGSLSSIGGVTYQEALERFTYDNVNAARKAANFAEVDPVTGAVKAGTGVYITRATYDANMAALAAQPDFRGRLTDNVGIAYGTTIENAEGGSGKDTIIGNDVDNRLSGNGGDDTIRGNQGDDTLLGDAGNDTLDGGLGDDELDGGEGNDRLLGGDGIDLVIGGAGDDVIVASLSSAPVATNRGELSLDMILDFGNGNDVIDLSGIDADTLVDGHQAFTFTGKSDPKTGEVGIKTYGNVNAAESVLGVDLDGVEGQSPFDGPVTVLFGNNDGDKDADFAIVLFNTKGLGVEDLVLAQAQIV